MKINKSMYMAIIITCGITNAIWSIYDKTHMVITIICYTIGLWILVFIFLYSPNSSSDKSESFNKGYEVNQK